ncbi:MAG: hypothetical protein JST55_01620 [Bacteroidetes bacterium]|nr:hypothetical protein [Bacteroidota bacterium]
MDFKKVFGVKNFAVTIVIVLAITCGAGIFENYFGEYLTFAASIAALLIYYFFFFKRNNKKGM